MKRDAPLVDRFWAKVRKTDSCWLWTGAALYAGYGVIQRGKPLGQALAHRLSYELHYGPIPDGSVIAHLCDTPACVRPDHLIATTQEGNLGGAVSRGRMARGDRNTAYLYPERRPRGERHGHAKANDALVRDLRRAYANGATLAALSRQYGLHRTCIAKIIKRQTWTHVAE